MVRKVPSFVTSIIPVVLNFMLDIEDDPEWNTHDVSEPSVYIFFEKPYLVLKSWHMAH